jgi:hypothetical protein
MTEVEEFIRNPCQNQAESLLRKYPCLAVPFRECSPGGHGFERARPVISEGRRGPDPQRLVQIALEEIESDTVARACQDLPPDQRPLFRTAYAFQTQFLMLMLLHNCGVTQRAIAGISELLASKLRLFNWFDLEVCSQLAEPTEREAEAFADAIRESTTRLNPTVIVDIAVRDAGFSLDSLKDAGLLLEFEIRRQRFMASILKAVEEA